MDSKHELFEGYTCRIGYNDKLDYSHGFLVEVEGQGIGDPVMTLQWSWTDQNGPDYNDYNKKRLKWQLEKHADKVREAYRLIFEAFDFTEKIPGLHQ